MRIRMRGVDRAVGLLLATLTARWMSTLQYEVAYFDPTVDPPHPEFRGPKIYLFWHEYIPILFYLRGHCGIAMLLSQHQDAQWLASAARYMGFSTVRGSSNRGGTAALRELFVRGRAMNLAITPDGPRGPRRRLAPGAIFLSSRLGIPLVPVGLGYAHPYRLPTWDRFAVPRPGCRARAVAGPAIQVPPDIDRRRIEAYRVHVEEVLNRLTEHAETWAESGRSHLDARMVYREGARLRGRMGLSPPSSPSLTLPPGAADAA